MSTRTLSLRRALVAAALAITPLATTTAVAQAAPAVRATAASPAAVQALQAAFPKAQAVSVAIARNGTLVYTAAYGWVDPAHRRTVTTSTRFRVGSISKTIATAALLELVERGQVSLNAPIVSLLPAGVVPAVHDARLGAVTLRQLLSHTGGLPVADSTFFGAPRVRGAATCRQAASSALGLPLTADPGTTYRYSNLNFCLAGLILQRLTGRPYDAAERALALNPLGITAPGTVTTYGAPAGTIRYALAPGRTYMGALGAAGTWTSSPTDLVRFVDGLDPAKPGPHVLSASTLATMTAREVPPDPKTPGEWYGLGLRVFDNGGSWGHTGHLEKVAAMVLHRADGITWAITVAGVSPTTEKMRATMDAVVAASGA